MSLIREIIANEGTFQAFEPYERVWKRFFVWAGNSRDLAKEQVADILHPNSRIDMDASLADRQTAFPVAVAIFLSSAIVGAACVDGRDPTR